MVVFRKLRLPFHDKRPLFLEARSSNWFITSTVCVATFTDIFLYAVIVPVFPFSLHDRIHVPESDVQYWLSVLLAVYGVGLLVGAPISGIVADRVKYRKQPLLIGLVTLLGTTIMLCLAKTIPLLIVARLLQGLSASVIWTSGLALLADTVRSDEIATSMGYVGSMYSLGTLIAPLLGGVVYEQSGYYAVFAMCFGVVALDVVLRVLMIEKKAAKKWLGECDTRQESCSSSVDHRDDDHDEMETKDPETLIVGRTKKGSAVEKEEITQNVSAVEHSKRKILPILILLKSRRVLAAFWGVLTISSVATGLDTTLTLFVSRTFGWNSLAAGILFLALLLPAFFAPLFGKHVDKHGPRWIGAFGLLFTVPFFVLLRLVDHNSTNQKVLLVALLVLVGFGYACALTALLAEFTIVCDAKERASPGLFGKGGAYAQSYSIFNISWAAGSVIGAFWSGGIYTAAGWGTVTWTWALVCGVSAIPVLLFTDGWIGKRRGLGCRQ